MGFWDTISGSFKNGWTSFTRGISNFGRQAVQAAGVVGTKIESGVKAIHQDVRDLVSGAGNLAKNTIEGGQKTLQAIANKAGDTITSTASSLSLPLLALGGAAIAFFVLKR